MKKLITTTFMIVALLITASVNLEANCVGTSGQNPAAFFGEAEVDTGYEQALENCCKGAIIYWFDFENNAGGVWIIGNDGENSSCAVE
tara:strand:+ start:1522 stop:1785 length:264 start_codon:yes stop_codon:yes gene_type:complete